MVDTNHSIDSSRRTLLGTLGFAGVAATTGLPSTTAADETNEDHVKDESNKNDDRDGITDRPQYELPSLLYDYGALEPHITERIMELHHAEHHQDYVDGANEAIAEMETMREQGNFEGLRAAKRDLSFNLSGHVLHSIFWENMTPDGGGAPNGELATALEERFGSFDAFVSEFSETAEQVQGPGWAILEYDHAAETLLITQAEKHNHFVVQGATPLLVLDVWEHAYYLQYENEREEYITEWWNVVDWQDVQRRYEYVSSAEIPISHADQE